MQTAPTSAFLERLVSARATPEASQWLHERCEEVATAGVGARLFMAFGMVPRRLGKAALSPTEAECEAASALRVGLDPRLWTVDQVGRMMLLLSLPSDEPQALSGAIDRLCQDADLGELAAVYRTLPLLPHQQAHRARAAEGVRSNMTGVLAAIALRNPYPAEQLDEGAFNQVVLKSLFVGLPLRHIVGLDGRVNTALAQALCNSASERWAAGREVDPMMWRCVGPVADGAMLEVLDRAIERDAGRHGLSVLLSVRDNPAADAIRERDPGLAARVRTGELGWEDVATGDDA